MTNELEVTKRANVKALNHTALKYVAGKEEEELTVGQELFIALLEGDDNEKDIEDKLYKYVCSKEYCWGHDGGEPDLVDILAIKLLEKVEEEKYLWSMIYSDRYLEHIGIKYKGKEKEW